ncbi:MAG: hypothetical protein WC374_00865 [Phycisphaerae bacterium]|jgi:hypothetical protein
MKLPELKKPDKYVGLYVVDFGDHSGVGFTAEEVAELLESEKFKDIKIYKIHNAYPDGRLELKGVSARTFQMETGMFFYSGDLETARLDYKKLTDIAVTAPPPCRAKLQLAKYSDGKFVTALIYPSEYNDELSRWLSDNNYKTAGPAEGGISAVTGYYRDEPEILERTQLFAVDKFESRTGEELLAATKIAVQR